MSGWRRVTTHEPCEACGRGDWCGRSADGAVVRCMRVASDHPCSAEAGGWIHRVGDGAPRAASSVRTLPAVMHRPELAELMAEMQKDATPNRVQGLATSLGVAFGSLRQLGIGYSIRKRAFAFPMVDAGRRIVGIRYRSTRDGSKFSERGGREGLFLPLNHSTPELLLLCEGASDCAALLSIGFRAIGRPSCTGGVKYCAAFARGTDVVVVADADAPGRRGAEALASTLTTVAKSVRVITPPPGAKDMRDAIAAGFDAPGVLSLVEAQPIRRLQLREMAR